MEELRNLKKSFIKNFENTLSSVGKDLVKEMEEKYSIDDQVCIDYAINLCQKISKMKGVSAEDEKKCQEFVESSYYLDKIKISELISIPRKY